MMQPCHINKTPNRIIDGPMLISGVKKIRTSWTLQDSGNNPTILQSAKTVYGAIT